MSVHPTAVNTATRPVQAWIKTTDSRMRVFGQTQLEGFVVASAALEGPAKRWLKSRPELSTQEDVKKGLLEEFDQKTSVVRLYELMAARKCKKNESLVDYLQNSRV